MYSIVYVLTDDEKLGIYQELMKSLISLRMHMPEKKVIVLTDETTYRNINDKDIMDMAMVQSIDTPDEMSLAEKSRYIKTKAREFVSGDMLVIDTDTVICKRFPEQISHADISAAYDMNNPERNLYEGFIEKVSKQSGTELKYDKFYNSGVVWSRDTDNARSFYKQWYELWNQTRLSGKHMDQPAFDHVIYHNSAMFEVLDDLLNCQLMPSLTNVGTPMNLFADAYVIHYFHDPYNPYAIGNEKYKDLPYTDERVLNFLRNPYTAFVRCRLIEIDEDGESFYKNNKLQQSRQYILIEYLWKKHRRIFKFNERVIAKLLGINQRIKRMTSKQH